MNFLVSLKSSTTTALTNPFNGSKSVLFAISDFTVLKRDENYPLIFDAATSSFGDSKEEGFYNVIDKLINDGSMDKFIQEATELAPQAVEE